jgi:1-acyl-sn-glycerol-3-phosphate acyltransferase
MPDLPDPTEGGRLPENLLAHRPGALSSTIAPDALTQADFVPLSLRGFGDGWNAYIHGMNWYEGRLYCGTFRANLCLKRRQTIAGPQYDPWPIECPDGDEFNKIDCRAQLWRFDPATLQWDMVQQSPRVMGRHGEMIQRECAYRGIFTFQGKSDTKPTLYVTPFSNTASPGPQILRSEDGITFETVTRPGLGLEGVSSFRSIVAFKGRIFTSPVGSNNNIVNYSKYPIVFESDDPANDVWRQVSEPGFGNPDNSVIFNLAPLGDYLYAGTFNHVTGFELWKTDAEGEVPYRWTKVLELGAFRGNLNEGVLSMCAFNGALYIGTCIQDGGFDRINQVGPAGGEILRVFPDDTWELVVGGSRLTEQGLLVPSSGLLPGFGDLFNGYIWRMAVHDGHLYVGTVNWSVFLRYVNVGGWPERMRKLIHSWGVDETIARFGGFDLWCSADGTNFTPVTTSGFGNTFNCGARTLVSTPLGLCVGTVNPFGPNLAVATERGWRYEPNPRGGGEVWLGAKPVPEAIRQMTPAGGPEGIPASHYRLPPVAPQHPRPGRRIEKVPAVALDQFQLRERERRIDLAGEAGMHLEEARDKYHLVVDGLENLPKQGRVLILANNPAVPVLVAGVSVPAHTLYLLDVISRHRGRPAWHLAPADQFDAVWSERSLPTLDRLGMMPRTPATAEMLLARGRAVLVYPEEAPSLPPYGLRPFLDEIIELATRTRAPIVPAIFVGTHESYLIIEHDNRQLVLNPGSPYDAEYAIRFLPALHEVSAQHLRDVMQATIDSLVERRPRTTFLRTLQRRYGDPTPTSAAAE